MNRGALRRQAIAAGFGLLFGAAAGAGASTEPAAPASRAPTQYVHHCSGCHLPDGSGAPSKGIPSMRGLLGQFLKVPGGREFIVQVPGVMNSPLGDRDIAALMNWLLPYVAAATMPVDTPPYSADEIAALRRSRPVDVPAARQRLVAAMQAAGLAVEPPPPGH